MYYDIRTARQVACVRKAGLPPDAQGCTTVRCGSWRFKKGQTGVIEVDGHGVERMIGYCGEAGEPAADVTLKHVR